MKLFLKANARNVPSGVNLASIMDDPKNRPKDLHYEPSSDAALIIWLSSLLPKSWLHGGRIMRDWLRQDFADSHFYEAFEAVRMDVEGSLNEVQSLSVRISDAFGVNIPADAEEGNWPQVLYEALVSVRAEGLKAIPKGYTAAQLFKFQLLMVYERWSSSSSFPLNLHDVLGLLLQHIFLLRSGDATLLLTLLLKHGSAGRTSHSSSLCSFARLTPPIHSAS